VKAIKIFGTIALLIVGAFVTYVLWMFSKMELEKNRARTANATANRWKKEEEEEFEDLETIENGNEEKEKLA